MTQTTNDDLLHRLNRIQGQIEAVKSHLASSAADESQNCQDILYQIKATRNALKKVGDQYITRYIESCLEDERGRPVTSMQKEKIESVLRTAFNT